MKKQVFTIRYSLLVNGEEYPRTIIVIATSAEAAKHQLNELVFKKEEVKYKINEVIAIS